MTHPPDIPVTDWFAAHPITATSLIWRRLQRTRQLRAARGAQSTQPDCAVQEKTALSHALLTRMKSVCQAAKLRCTLVSLQRPIDLTLGAGWRADLYRDATGPDLPLIDTGPLMRSLPQGWAELYGADDHPSVLGNQQIATFIDQFLSEHDPGNSSKKIP